MLLRTRFYLALPLGVKISLLSPMTGAQERGRFARASAPGPNARQQVMEAPHEPLAALSDGHAFWFMVLFTPALNAARRLFVSWIRWRGLGGITSPVGVGGGAQSVRQRAAMSNI